MSIHYIKGDATAPVGDGKKIICHICNDIGAWGAGFVLAISKKWKAPEAMYRSINVRDLRLGNVQFVKVEDDITVANMIGQHGIAPVQMTEFETKPPIRYGAVRAALATVNDRAFRTNSTLHMPRIGCGLAGGNWDQIEKIIKEIASVDVYVYDLK